MTKEIGQEQMLLAIATILQFSPAEVRVNPLVLCAQLTGEWLWEVAYFVRSTRPFSWFPVVLLTRLDTRVRRNGTEVGGLCEHT